MSPKALARAALVERQEIHLYRRAGGLPLAVVPHERSELLDDFVDDLQQHRARVAFCAGHRRSEPALEQPLATSLHLAVGQAVPQGGERVGPPAIERGAGQDDGQDPPVVDVLQRPLAQQADGFDHLGRRPGNARLGRPALLGPSVEQPPATVGRRLEAVQQPGGIIRVVGTGAAIRIRPDAGIAVRVRRSRQEPSAEVGNFLPAPACLLERHGRDLLRQHLDLEPVGAFEPPGMAGGLADEVLLEGIARLAVGRPGGQAPLEFLGILTRQDQRPGGQAVLDRIEGRKRPPLRRARAARAPRVASVGFDLQGRGHRLG